jgi:DNA-binding MarR family transcriptional regulator
MDKAAAPLLQSAGLSEHQAGIIMAVKHDDAYSISKLAEHLNANQGNFSAACKRLEQMGLLNRKRSREDERVVTLELTALGEEKARQICLLLDEMFRKAEATPEQVETVIAGYSEIVNLLRKINQKGVQHC